jgi:hypothetical protein
MKLSHRSVPFALLLVCILGYGMYILWMGFYWDDWAWVWFSHVMGSQGMLKIDLEHRPLSGVVLWVGSLLARESTVGWQLYNLFFRWLTGVSLWWMLLKIWPKRGEFAAAVSLLFLVYPGFSQQFVAVNNSRHLLPLALFAFSIGWMVKACRDHSHFWRDTTLALALSLVGLLISDYYYGLELVRPAILWLLTEQRNLRSRFQAVLLDWLPYFILLGAIFIWRYWVSTQYFYRVSLLDDPFGINTSLRNIVLDPIEFTLGAWLKILEMPDSQFFGPRMTALFILIVVIGMLGSFVYLWKLPVERQNLKGYGHALVLGVIAAILAFIPFWVSDLEVEFAFPNDRLTLPILMGASLIWVSLLFLAVRNRVLRILLLSVTIGLSLGVQLKHANLYRRDWDYQAAFFDQLTWRVPGIEPGTVIIANEILSSYSTDNSLSAPLNWIYHPDYSGGDMPLIMLYTTRFEKKSAALSPENIIERGYRFFRFRGSLGDSIVVYITPSACLRVLDPVNDRHFPQLPDDLERMLPFADNQRINDGDSLAQLPGLNLGTLESSNWCYYFEKADLARQYGDWLRVTELGDQAFSLDDSPNHASERIPFIEGYAHVGRWSDSLELTQETIQINKYMAPMLCDTWERIAENTPASSEKEQAILSVDTLLLCDLK